MIEIKNTEGTVLAIVDAANLRYANLQGAGLRGADLQGANLQGAYLRGANLRGAVLRDAYLQGADLQDAYLQGAYLRGADLQGANLQGAYLQDAYLQGANLRYANLQGADLRGAVLRDAYLQGADLWGADLPPFQTCPTEGSFVAWKSARGKIVKLQIPADARRTSSLVGRKCRADRAVTLSITGKIDGAHCDEIASSYTREFVYRVGETVSSDDYDDDIRVECTHGIHFFITREEAEAWD